jgi:hypothetical protein
MFSPAPAGWAFDLVEAERNNTRDFFCKGHLCDYLDARLTGW